VSKPCSASVAHPTARVVSFARGPASGCSSVKSSSGSPGPGSARPLGPHQPHRPAETGDVMKADLAASVADRDNAAIRATCKLPAGFNAQNQSSDACRDSADVDALDTEQRIHALHQRPREQETELFMSGSLWYWFAWSLPNQRGPDLFPAAPRRTKNGLRCGGRFRRS
jgi:hypothetical protein